MAQYRTFKTMNTEPVQEKRSDYQVPRITSFQERQQYVNKNKIVVVDNYTEWCGPCKFCAPKFAVLAQKYSRPGMCVFVKEDVDDAIPTKGMSEQVEGVPCFHFYLNGHYQKDLTITGADMALLEETLEKLFR